VSDPVHKPRNKTAIRVAIGASVAVVAVLILFLPLVPVNYEERVIVQDEGGESIVVGRMVTKNVSVFQILTGTD
jgi:hypothetical protein